MQIESFGDLRSALHGDIEAVLPEDWREREDFVGYLSTWGKVCRFEKHERSTEVRVCASGGLEAKHFKVLSDRSRVTATSGKGVSCWEAKDVFVCAGRLRLDHFRGTELDRLRQAAAWEVMFEVVGEDGSFESIVHDYLFEQRRRLIEESRQGLAASAETRRPGLPKSQDSSESKALRKELKKAIQRLHRQRERMPVEDLVHLYDQQKRPGADGVAWRARVANMVYTGRPGRLLREDVGAKHEKECTRRLFELVMRRCTIADMLESVQ